MNETAQLIVTLLLIGWAAAYVLWRGWALVRRRSGCSSGCAGCPIRSNSSQTLVQIGTAAPREKR